MRQITITAIMCATCALFWIGGIKLAVDNNRDLQNDHDELVRKIEEIQNSNNTSMEDIIQLKNEVEEYNSWVVRAAFDNNISLGLIESEQKLPEAIHLEDYDFVINNK